MIRTEDVVAPHQLMELFATGDDEDDGPDLNACGGVIQVCDGEWRREPDGFFWRFWEED